VAGKYVRLIQANQLTEREAELIVRVLDWTVRDRIYDNNMEKTAVSAHNKISRALKDKKEVR